MYSHAFLWPVQVFGGGFLHDGYGRLRRQWVKIAVTFKFAAEIIKNFSTFQISSCPLWATK